MKVINLSFDDHSNLSYMNSKALRSVGVDCQAYTVRLHPFGYEDQATKANIPEMIRLAQGADIVQVFHSWDFIRAKGITCKKVIWHTGTSYRQNVEGCNHLFNDVVDITITDQCEFMHLGGKNIHYMATAIDTDKIKPIVREIKKPYLIGHYPSNATVKGAAKIKEMMAKLSELYPGEFIFDCDETVLPHQQNLDRIAKCDIYIELFAPTQHGKEYGCFGVTAFEAAAMGVRCFTQNCHSEVYDEAYGSNSIPFRYADDEEMFFHFMSNEITGDTQQHIKMKAGTRERLVKSHSLTATGDRMKMILGI